MYFHQKWSRSCIRKPVPGVMEFVILEYIILIHWNRILFLNIYYSIYSLSNTNSGISFLKEMLHWEASVMKFLPLHVGHTKFGWLIQSCMRSHVTVVVRWQTRTNFAIGQPRESGDLKTIFFVFLWDSITDNKIYFNHERLTLILLSKFVWWQDAGHWCHHGVEEIEKLKT